jgi:hypothetical protein
MTDRKVSRDMERVLAIAVTMALAVTSGCGYLRLARDNVPMTAAPEVARLQTLNPEAGRNPKVVAGLDAQAAVKVQESYVKSFERTDTQSRAIETFAGLTGLKTD